MAEMYNALRNETYSNYKVKVKVMKIVFIRNGFNLMEDNSPTPILMWE